MTLHLQLKRNQEQYTSKEEALSGLTEELQKIAPDTAEGEPMVAIYAEGEEESATTKILFGIADGKGGYSIFDSEAAASEAQDVLKQIMGDGDPDDNYDTITEIANALVTINGSGEGSIQQAVKDAVNALDVADSAEDMKFVTAVSETDGKITVTRGKVTSNGGTITLTNGGDGGINIEVVSSALTQYTGAEAIKVSEESGGNKTISLAINAADKVLKQSGDGLLANINLTWSTTDGLKLIGKDSTEIATIPAADFIKDGMLQNVELKVASVDTPVDTATTGTFLVFTFNADAGPKVINLDVTSLIDVYTAGNGINVAGKEISAKIDPTTEKFLTVGADGIKLSGVQDAINTAKGEETAAIDKIEASVGLGTDGSHVNTNGKYTSGATTVVGEIDALDTALAAVSGKADSVQAEVDLVETAVGLGENGSFTKFTGTNYINDATSIANASVLLDKQVKAEETRATAAENALGGRIDTLSGNAVTGITAGNGISVSGTGNTRTVAVRVKDADPLIEVTSAGVGIKDGGVIDCGTY